MITGGHMTPALALIGELRKRGYINIVWVGNRYNQAGNKEVSAEYRTISDMNIPFVELKTGKLVRHITLQNFLYAIKQFLYIFWGFIKAFYIILFYKPKLLMSFGGYLAVPLAFWAWVFRKKIIAHEQVIVAGLANRIIAKFANKICISWLSSEKFYNRKKIVLTGNPIRREIFTAKSNSLTSEFDPSKPIIYITCGNQGSHEVNMRIFGALPLLLKEANIIHQTGNSSATNDFLKAREVKKQLPAELMIRYTIRDYVDSSEIGEAFQKSNLIISRAGANTITEIMALGKFAILIPLPNTSHDEQVKNAKFLESLGLAYVLEQSDRLSAQTFYQTVLIALNQINSQKGFNGQPIEDIVAYAQKQIDLDAHFKLANEVEKLLN